MRTRGTGAGSSAKKTPVKKSNTKDSNPNPILPNDQDTNPESFQTPTSDMKSLPDADSVDAAVPAVEAAAEQIPASRTCEVGASVVEEAVVSGDEDKKEIDEEVDVKEANRDENKEEKDEVDVKEANSGEDKEEKDEEADAKERNAEKELEYEVEEEVEEEVEIEEEDVVEEGDEVVEVEVEEEEEVEVEVEVEEEVGDDEGEEHEGGDTEQEIGGGKTGEGVEVRSGEDAEQGIGGGEIEEAGDADTEEVEEDEEIIEEIEYEYEDEEDGAEGEEGGADGEEEVEMEEDEQGEDAEEAAEQFAKEYPDAQQVMPVSERQKRKKREVFVGGLDRDATEEDIKKVFERVGEVKEVRLMKSFRTGKNKGFAFVQYGTAAEAKRATIELERVQVRGRMCGVVPSEENDILFIGNLNKSWDKETVIESLKKYGVGNVEELNLMEDPQHEGMNRGFAFVEFSTHKDAKFAFKHLQRPNIVLGTDRPAKIAWADPINEPDDEVMAQVKSVFVDGMPTTWDEERAKEHFSQYGEIERIVLARNMPFAKRKDFGFVNFAARESAVACVEGMNNAEIADGDLKMKVKVKLSKPQLRTVKPVGSGLRGGYHMDWHRGRWGFRGGRFARGRGRGVEPSWGRAFESTWARGAGRFGFGRGRARVGRGYFRGISRGASFSGRHQLRDGIYSEQRVSISLEEQTAQDDSMTNRVTMNHEEKGGSLTGSGSEGGRPSREKFECTMCGFCSDVELEFNAHQTSRVHKALERMRKEEKLNNKTPLSLLHEYASRHRCEVHYDIAADNPLGPFEVFATIGGGNTGIPFTRGIGKGCDKAKARQMAASDALEKIMDRIPDLEFGRPVQYRQQTYEHPVSEMHSRGFHSSRSRVPPNPRPFSDYGPPPYPGGRSRSGHLSRENGHSRIRNPGPSEYDGRAARPYSRGPKRIRYDDDRDHSESYGGGRDRGSSRGRDVLAAHREAYFQHLEQSQGQGYGPDRLTAAIREYGEALPGAKRAVSALDDDPRMDLLPHRGHPRARAERLDLVPGSSEYASRSLYPAAMSHPPALDTAGIYSTTSQSHVPVYGGSSDIHGSAELLAGSRYPSSSFYGYSQGPPGSGYSVGGPGPGSYY